MNENTNDLVQIRAWFGSNVPCSAREFADFWKACSTEDKDTMKSMALV